MRLQVVLFDTYQAPAKDGPFVDGEVSVALPGHNKSLSCVAVIHVVDPQTLRVWFRDPFGTTSEAVDFQWGLITEEPN